EGQAPRCELHAVGAADAKRDVIMVAMDECCADILVVRGAHEEHLHRRGVEVESVELDDARWTAGVDGVRRRVAELRCQRRRRGAEHPLPDPVQLLPCPGAYEVLAA